MCGIVGAVAQRNVAGILIEGLKRLEYRGYDSAGVAVLHDQSLSVYKRQGKVSNIEHTAQDEAFKGHLGIAHTRWATHGIPSESNAHPHISGNQRIAIVHNGIIENYQTFKEELLKEGYQFHSETDSEVIPHYLEHLLTKGQHTLLSAVQHATSLFEGAYAIAVIDKESDDTMVVARSGSPLVIGVGIEENFIASDIMALRQVTDRFIYLEEGEIAQLQSHSIETFDSQGKPTQHKIVQVSGDAGLAEKDGHSHYMYKEIHEQPHVLGKTLEDRINNVSILDNIFTQQEQDLLKQINSIHIIACGTSYHAGMIAKHWIEEVAEIPCGVDIASEYRYRKVLMGKNTLFLSVSQSGETADTLAALRARKEQYKATMTVCNVDNSSLVRESDIKLLTHAGPEIGVASTKAFTTQLAALQVFALALAKLKGNADDATLQEWVEGLHQLPQLSQQVLSLDKPLQAMAKSFADKHHSLFLGRGVMYPVAKEGALKLKEISYIHAEAYSAGELKHGPLALVDADMPVIAVAPNNELLEKLKSNLQEVKARGGQLYVFADKNSGFENEDNVTVIPLPHVPDNLVPIVYTIPLQLLSYHVAIIKGTDVDQPRNLAKSVTVE